MPSVLPTMTARPKPSPSTRRRPPGAEELRLESDKDDVDWLADVTRRVTRAARFEFHIAGLPSVHDRPAVRRVLYLATGEVHDDRIRAVCVKAFARIDLHARTKDGDT